MPHERKIIFVVPYPIDKAPSQRLKFEQYYPAFKQAGFSITHSSFMSDEMWSIVYKKGFFFQRIFYTLQGYLKRTLLLFSIRKYDIVYVHLWCTPFGAPFFEWLVARLSKKLIYDIDDLVFLKNAKHEKQYYRFLKGRDKPVFLMRKAGHVITCTPYLDDFARKFNNNTTDISSTINTEKYVPVNRYTNDHTIVLGWSGSHSTAQYLYLLTDALQKLSKLISFKLLVIGGGNVNIPGVEVEVMDWNSENEVTNLQKIDIGLYPLPLNEEWVLGKSGLKALQYMALGLPAVATRVGCNDRVIKDKLDGFLVSSDGEWIETIQFLCENPSVRKSIGIAARKKVESSFSVAANTSKYLAVLNG
jgi:glycosyltransferase involved in cell wall biosynthesis